MTKPALEALVNALLAPSQPITANGMHKPSMQKIMDEMYDAQSRGNVLAGVGASGSLSGGDTVLIIRSGVAYIVPASLLGVNHWRGDYAGTSSMPVTGGNFTGGLPMAGDQWRLTATLEIDDATYYAGTIIQAMVNSPGDTLTNWAFLAGQI